MNTQLMHSACYMTSDVYSQHHCLVFNTISIHVHPLLVHGSPFLRKKKMQQHDFVILRL